MGMIYKVKIYTLPTGFNLKTFKKHFIIYILVRSTQHVLNSNLYFLSFLISSTIKEIIGYYFIVVVLFKRLFIEKG